MRHHDKTIIEPEVAQGFDLVVHKRNARTGLVEQENAYILRIVGHAKYLERPVGSGNVYDFQGKPIGRWDASKPEGERFLKGEKHVEWSAPETKDQKLARAIGEKDIKIQELERELAAIQAERELKVKSKSKEE